MSPRRPVKVTVEPLEAAEALTELLEDYFAELDPESSPPLVSIVPIDAHRRGTVIYRVIQASRTIAQSRSGPTTPGSVTSSVRFNAPVGTARTSVRSPTSFTFGSQRMIA